MAELYERLMRDSMRLSRDLRAERAENERLRDGMMKIAARLDQYTPGVRFDAAGAIDDLLRG